MKSQLISLIKYDLNVGCEEPYAGKIDIEAKTKLETEKNRALNNFKGSFETCSTYNSIIQILIIFSNAALVLIGVCTPFES